MIGLCCRPGQASVSEREPGPILPDLSMRLGVWVPAFAGTTERLRGDERRN